MLLSLAARLGKTLTELGEAMAYWEIPYWTAWLGSKWDRDLWQDWKDGTIAAAAMNASARYKHHYTAKDFFRFEEETKAGRKTAGKDAAQAVLAWAVAANVKVIHAQPHNAERGTRNAKKET